MKLQKRLAASVLGCSPYRVRFDEARLDEIKEAITKEDIRRLISRGIVERVPVLGVSRSRAEIAHVQRSRGRRRGPGSRKGVESARQDPKRVWIAGIRKQRELLLRLKENGSITQESYKMLYARAKGRFFRSARHMKLFMEEQGLFRKG